MVMTFSKTVEEPMEFRARRVETMVTRAMAFTGIGARGFTWRLVSARFNREVAESGVSVVLC